MRTSVKVTEVKVGDVLVVDDVFTCIPAWTKVVIYKDEFDNLYFPCDQERHYLDGQIDDTRNPPVYVGLEKAR